MKGKIRIWNAWMKAHGRNGDTEKCKQILTKMQNETDLKADNQIFKTLINAHSHSGNQLGAKLMWQHEIGDELK